MLNKLKRRIRGLFFRSRMEDELREELRFHLEKETEHNLSRGMTQEEARSAALDSFGRVELVREQRREGRVNRLLENLWQDLGYGVRVLLKKPGFFATFCRGDSIAASSAHPMPPGNSALASLP